MTAYKEMYLDDAMRTLGEAFDYASHRLSVDPDIFWQMMLVSGYADRFGHGEPKVICGMSGADLAWEVCSRAGYPLPEEQPVDEVEDYGCTSEYWAGWILAYTQWRTGQRFRDLTKNVTMKQLVRMYAPLHEASEEKAADILERRMYGGMDDTADFQEGGAYGCTNNAADIREGRPDSIHEEVPVEQLHARRMGARLQEYRKRLSYTQRELAEQADVNLRTLQQYETGAKQLDRAAGGQLMHLAQALGCTVEELIS